MGKLRSQLNGNAKSRHPRFENLEDRVVLSANFQQAGISQVAIDLINNNPYSSTILADDALINTLNAIATTQTAPPTAQVITSEAGFASITAGTVGSPNEYLIQGDLTVTGTFEVPSNVHIYVDGSIFKQGAFTSPDVHSTENGDDAIFRLTNADNVKLIGVNNALLHSNPDLSSTAPHTPAIYIGNDSDNVEVDGFEIANVWEGIVARSGGLDIDNTTITNNYIHGTVKRAIWSLGSNDLEAAHNFIENPGVDGLDWDAFTMSATAYENVVLGAGRWAGFVEEGAQDSYFIRGLAVMADMGNPNIGFQLGWADNGSSANFVGNNPDPASWTQDNYFIDNVVFESAQFPPSGQGGGGDYFAKENAGKGQTYFWANRGFGAGQSPNNFDSAEWLNTIPTAGGPGGTINGVQILSDLNTKFNSFEVLATGDIAGDFNGDLTVDGADLVQWQGDYGLNGDSDANGDGDSNGIDFLIWQRTLGNSGAPADDNVVTILDTTFAADQGYVDGNLQFQEPFGSSSGIWLGQASAQVDSSGSGSASSVGGPFDRNAWSIGATGGQGGVPSVAGFDTDDSLRITFDYQFDLASNVNTGLATVGIRDEGPNANNGFEASPQQGFSSTYSAFADGSIRLFPDLNDGADLADALIIDAALVGLDPTAGTPDLISDNLRIVYQASTDGAGNWTVDSFSVENLDSQAIFAYAGPEQSFTFASADAFYSQQLAINGNAGFTGTTDGVKFEYVMAPPAQLDVFTRVDTDFTAAEGFADGNLQFQNGWLGQAGPTVDSTGTGTVSSSGAFLRNLFSTGATGVTANATDESGNGFKIGDQIHIEQDYQFTLDASANRELFLTGFRPNFNTTVDSLAPFNASPTIGMEAFYSNFDAAATGGALKLFSNFDRNGFDGADNDFALFANGFDLGLDPENATTPDLVSDRLRFTYTVEYQGSDSWNTVELGVTNLDTNFSTLASTDKPAALESFTYAETQEAFFGSTWTRSAIDTSVDRVLFQYLTPPPVSVFAYETDFTAADGFAAGNLQFQNGWLGQTGATVDETGSGTVTSGGPFLRNLYNVGLTGSIAGSATDGVGTGFNEGDVIAIEHEYQFTLDAFANRALNLTGFRENFSTGGFDATPTAGFKAAYSPFDPANSGSLKLFTDITRSGTNGADNAFALFANGDDIGLDVGTNDLVSDNLLFTYKAQLADANTNTWTATELTIENLDTGFTTSAAIDKPAALESFVYTGTDAYLASRWTDSAATVTTDRIKVEYLDPLPVGPGSLAASSADGGLGDLVGVLSAAVAHSSGDSSDEAVAPLVEFNLIYDAAGEPLESGHQAGHSSPETSVAESDDASAIDAALAEFEGFDLSFDL
ncbi:MAG: hypothetical protein AAGD11_09235 [Planctomycetota bacterium]